MPRYDTTNGGSAEGGAPLLDLPLLQPSVGSTLWGNRRPQLGGAR